MPQGFDLVPSLAVVHNVLAGRLGAWSLGRSLVSLVVPREVALARAALDRVGIAEKLYVRTSRLSGGEQQRVALARLLVQEPRVILADEPVSSVDPARAEDLLAMLVDIAGEEGRTLVASMHAVPLALRYFSRVVALRAGRVIFDRPTASVTTLDLDALYALEARTRVDAA
jgi:phosphonate transport system ATP-binding protein